MGLENLGEENSLTEEWKSRKIGGRGKISIGELVNKVDVELTPEQESSSPYHKTRSEEKLKFVVWKDNLFYPFISRVYMETDAHHNTYHKRIFLTDNVMNKMSIEEGDRVDIISEK